MQAQMGRGRGGEGRWGQSKSDQDERNPNKGVWVGREKGRRRTWMESVVGGERVQGGGERVREKEIVSEKREGL